MFAEEFNAAAAAAEKKAAFLKENPLGYFIASMLAGAFVGFGVLLSFTIGGLLGGAPYAKVVMGASFGVALSLVVMAGAELFTGNNLVMAAGCLKRTVKLRQAAVLWLVCWLGNLLGSVALALFYWGTGLASGDVGAFMASSAAGKMAAAPGPLFFRGLLCNMLVCLAVWCGFRCKSESGKLIMVWWCLFAFVTTGMEHSVANMTLLTVALLSPCGAVVSFGGWAYNLLVVTLGNMAGGILFLALPYYAVSRERRK